MRPWIFVLVIGAGLPVAGVLPAAANNVTSRSPAMAVTGHPQAAPLQPGFRRHSPMGPFGFGGPVVVPDAFFDGDSQPRIIAGLPPVVMAPAAAPRHSAVEERPSVETTVEGIVIVRGPGSRHVGR